MKRFHFILLCLCCFCFGCSLPVSQDSSLLIEQGGSIYDSVQKLVAYGKDYWPSNSFYVLEYLANRNDSIDLKLTVLPNQIERRFLNYCYLYNDDSTFLLVSKGNPLLSPAVDNRIGDVIDNNIVRDSVFAIFNPPIWRLVITHEGVLLDRAYGAEEAEKREIHPTVRFVPPKEN